MRRPPIALLCISLALAACGGATEGGEPSSPAASPAPTTHPPTTPTAPATTSSPQATVGSTAATAPAPVADHTSTDLSRVPPEWLARARATVVWAYGSTSHGTQLWAGAEALAPDLPFTRAWRAAPPPVQPPALRMAYDDGWAWDPATFYDTGAALLNAVPEATAFLWSWCGELSDEGTDVRAYLAAMARLEAAFPAVTFVYMTGHTDGGSPALAANNDLIRAYAAEHGKPLYDFADIESWDPGGGRHPATDDSCPWCASWCDAHPEDCGMLPAECAHSHPLNCVLKARALWWLSARLAGWDGS